MNSVYRATICKVTGTTSSMSRPVRIHCSSRTYASMIAFMFAGSWLKTGARRSSELASRSPRARARRGLLDRVDRCQDFVRLDFLGERLFHRSRQLQEFGAVGEGVDADLSLGLQLLQDLV